MENELTNYSSNCAIVSVRMVDAPRNVVYKAWTDPTILAKWWGPKGFTNTFHEFDLKSQGKWRFVMHAPNGKNYQNENIFVTVDPPNKLVWNHITGPKFQVIATFEEVGIKTKITFRMIFNSISECEHIKIYAIEGNEQNFDRLQAELAKLRTV